MEAEKELIEYTAHALARMSARRISKEMVQQTVANPEQTAVGYGGRLLAYKSFDDRKIKVVYTKEEESIVIVTVLWD